MAKINDDARKVFVSYIRENSTEIDSICAEFKGSDIKYWLDRDQIDPGKLWKKAIRDAINNGAYFLACFSQDYEKRSETYMNEELLVAIEILRTKSHDSGWFIPIKLSECKIPDMEIGAGKTLSDIQCLNLYEDWETRLKRLIDVIKREESPAPNEHEKSFFEKQYIYQGLKSLIESGAGTGFHNADLGHPVYVVGAKELDDSAWVYADSAKKNTLFKMLSTLSKELKESGIEGLGMIWWYDFSEWKDFCKFALDVYEKTKGRAKRA